MNARRIRPGHRGARGKFPSFKSGGLVPFESSLERDFLLLLEADPRVKTFGTQPIKLTNVKGHYTPDIRIEFNDGTFELVEVKCAEEIASYDAKEHARFEARCSAAQAWCAAQAAEGQAWRFVVRTDRDIPQDALLRAQWLRRHASPPPSWPQLRAAVETSVRARPGLSLDDVVAAVAHPEARATALHMAWVGLLTDRPIGELSGATQLWPAGGAS